MIVEVMGALIIVGVAMVLYVRYQGAKNQQPAREQQEHEMWDSTERLKAELERSGNEIIQRMGTHVSQLEKLIHETDEKTDMLNRRMAELQAVRQGIQQQLAEGRVFQQQLSEQYLQCQQVCQQMEAAYQRMSMPVRMPPVAEFPASHSFSAQPLQTGGIAPDPQPPPQSFSQILQDSMERGEEQASMPQDVYEPSPEARQAQMDAHNVGEGQKESSGEGSLNENVAAKARALLMAGHSVEEVSRETGMGRGAVELLRQMVQRQSGEP